jgi:hypothetical protein
VVLKQVHRRYGRSNVTMHELTGVGVMDDVREVMRVVSDGSSIASATTWKATRHTRSRTDNSRVDTIRFNVGTIGSERDPPVALWKRQLFAETLSDANLVNQRPPMQVFAECLLRRSLKQVTSDQAWSWTTGCCASAWVPWAG